MGKHTWQVIDDSLIFLKGEYMGNTMSSLNIKMYTVDISDEILMVLYNFTNEL